MGEELLPCPHCGGKADYGYDLCIVQCLVCGVCTDYRDNSDEAVAIWNRRVAPTQLPLPVAEEEETDDDDDGYYLYNDSAWTEMQLEANEVSRRVQAKIEKAERELLASVAGDGNEYMVQWTYGGEAILTMVKQGKSAL